MAGFESGTRELMNTVAEATKNGAITIIGMLYSYDSLVYISMISC